MFKHICVATDGSAASEHAASLAASLALTHSARLTILYVVDPYPFLMVGETNPMGFQSYMSAAHGLATSAINKAMLICQNAASLLDVQSRVVEEMAAAPGIVQAAQAAGCDLIVLGSHGRSGIRRLMLGSVCARVVAESTIPVLVTR